MCLKKLSGKVLTDHSPMVGRIETEFLNPLITAIYQSLIKYNRVPILEGATRPPDIEYVSPLSKAQKSSTILALNKYWASSKGAASVISTLKFMTILIEMNVSNYFLS